MNKFFKTAALFAFLICGFAYAVTSGDKMIKLSDAASDNAKTEHAVATHNDVLSSDDVEDEDDYQYDDFDENSYDDIGDDASHEIPSKQVNK